MSTTLEGLPVAQQTEVRAKAQRRRFTAAEKLRVLREADGCTMPGELSARRNRIAPGSDSPRPTARPGLC